MKEKLEKQIKKAKKALSPSHSLYDGCKQIVSLIEMMYLYLEEKFSDNTRTSS